ncbi:putative Transposase-associated domain-containing protein [Helianthus annuus]|uniref:uncharacterized protein LOC110894260 n=1 Tax=Helianthus annuus TaxID=4232 RepID=UPI000B90993A|nr:uncharacterized protein LOC110894260 [Helianthus annuus]XP_021997147.1 uncharacterized protein LOC110894260 [Helianthus annuus]KAJ0492169.1 putative Transposase-associated domain-containing protein [Helianthus annuus]KAJ0504463.1 putative Transposase-associated domain-containing protein [Helianthus annuus]KAJ0674180.1 putative Transposase-associated domain-containing protein [Helianthus annuus]
MNLDKSWTKITNKVDPNFIRGAIAFAKWAERYADTEGRIHCPCRNCVNARRHVPDVVADHIIQYSFEPTYNVWIYHGEHLPGYETDTDETNSEFEESDNESNDGVGELLDDAFPTGGNTEAGNFRDGTDQRSNPNVEKLFVDMMKPLYPGCDEFSVLGFLLELMNVKVTCKMTNVSMDMILNLFSRAFKDANLPKNHYEAKKYLRTLGLGYESIHACKHDCALFWKENANLQTCPVCSTSRYEENSKGRKKPVKILRYFPITSRLKRLYASRHTAKEMLWHDHYRTKEEGVLRHPADGKAWKHFDTTFPDFANDPRNVRLGLASDGFNPFGAKSLSYSMWPVVLIPYNMPPWKSMVDASFMLALLIPGKDSPGKDIDVFLRPLIDELKLLWDTGVETYDCESKQTFNMRAALLWTINDFPAYGYLSGWSTSGYKACPICNEDASSIYIRDKIAYVGHRRFLPLDHSWRKARDFNGKKETRLAPKPVNGDDCLRQLEHLTIHHHGKHKAHGGKKRKRNPDDLNWSKRSIFFELPYWPKLLIRHNIDVMHVEKNVCENVLGTLLNIEGKTKDTDKARLDLEDMNIRKELHLVRKNDHWVKPHASYVLTRDERKQFCNLLSSVRFPDGYAGNLAKNVNVEDGKVYGLKSHDCHVLIQRIIPIAIRPFMTKQIRDAIVELSLFFKKLTEVTLHVTELEALQKNIVKIMCKLEQIFPPSFFTVMMHLCVHLPQEAILGGPVQSRWMYPIERYLGHLKKYVGNNAKPEGSIAEGYVVEEAITFCSHYLRGVESKLDKRDRNVDKTSSDARSFALDIFRLNGRGVGKKEVHMLPTNLMKKAIWFIFNNCQEVQPYLEEHLQILQNQHPESSDFSEMQQSTFPDWFAKRVREMYALNPSQINEELYALSCLPDNRVSSQRGYIVNGVKFLVKSSDDCRQTQNCGVTVPGVHNDIEDDYYGLILIDEEST